MFRRSASRDEGFTFAEMTVVLALLGVMLAVVYSGMKVVYDGRSASDRQALVAREIGAPLQQMEKSLTQNVVLEQATAYAITALIDRPVYDGTNWDYDNIERHVISATTDGRIVEQIWATDALRQNTGLIRTVVWSEHNANQSSGVPLFNYLDVSGMPMTTDQTNAQSVNVRIVANHDGRSFEGSRTVFFRNR